MQVVPLWLVASWQAETQQFSESSGGEEVGLQGEGHTTENQREMQKAGERERSTTQLASNPEKDHDSKENWCWVSSAPVN